MSAAKQAAYTMYRSQLVHIKSGEVLGTFHKPYNKVAIARCITKHKLAAQQLINSINKLKQYTAA